MAFMRCCGAAINTVGHRVGERRESGGAPFIALSAIVSDGVGLATMPAGGLCQQLLHRRAPLQLHHFWPLLPEAHSHTHSPTQTHLHTQNVKQKGTTAAENECIGKSQFNYKQTFLNLNQPAAGVRLPLFGDLQCH